MKKIQLIAVLFLFTFSAKSQLPKADSSVEAERKVDLMLAKRNAKYVNKPFPDFTISTGKNDTLTNKNLVGKVTFVNLWFISCPPCLAETDGLIKLYDTLKANPDFQYLSIATDKKEEMDKFILKHNIPFPVYQMPVEGCRKLNFNNGFPTSMVLDRNGVIKSIFVGGFIQPAKAYRSVFRKFYPAILDELQKQ